MAKDRVSATALVASGDWRPSKHAARLADPKGVADPSEDRRLWELLEFWQERLDQADKDLGERGLTILNAGDQEQPNPAVKIAKDASTEIRALAAILGIGALNRARLGVSPESDDDEPDDGIGVRRR